MQTLEALRMVAGRHGATVGVTDLAPYPDVAEAMNARIEDGTSAGLTFTYKDPAKATEPERSFPWGRSIVVIVLPYLTDGDGPGDRSVARFAHGNRYDALVDALADVEAHLGADGWRTESVIDDDRLVDRAIAVRAGAGWWGKSTMVLTPGAGPWVLIGSVVTDAELPHTEPMKRSCGTCIACIPACPTGAIVSPGVLDARRCLAAIFQSRGDIPEEFREAAGGRIYGCDDCLTACPPGSRALESLPPSTDQADPAAVLSMTDGELDILADHWYVPGRKMRWIRRNALVALGNTGGPDDTDILMRYAVSDDDMLVRHARWAIEALR